MTNSNNLNLNSHYSSNSKVELPKNVVVSAPVALPSSHLYGDVDANRRLRTINNDIYEKTQSEKSNFTANFIKVFLGGVIAITAFCGARKFFK